MAMKRKNLPEVVPQVFEHEQFGSVRVVKIDGKPFFVGIDLCRALGYENSRKALKDHVDDEDKKVLTRKQWEKMASNQDSNETVLSFSDAISWFSSENMGGTQRLIFVNESGMYALIFGSQLPAAKKFKRWVTSEVLPSIRETGSYSLPQKKKKELPPLPPGLLTDDPTDFGNVARLEMFLEEHGIEYDYDLVPEVVKGEDGKPIMRYNFKLVIKD